MASKKLSMETPGRDWPWLSPTTERKMREAYVRLHHAQYMHRTRKIPRLQRRRQNPAGRGGAGGQRRARAPRAARGRREADRAPAGPVPASSPTAGGGRPRGRCRRGLKRLLIREDLNVIQSTSPRRLMPHLLHQMVQNRTNLGGHSIQIMIISSQVTR